MVSSGARDDGPGVDDDPGVNRDPDVDLDTVNGLLADWAARSAADSDALIECFESMGYEVRGKSEEAIAEVLRHPPTRAGKRG